MAGCPTVKELNEFQAGKLNENKSATIRAHLSTCESCRVDYELHLAEGAADDRDEGGSPLDATVSYSGLARPSTPGSNPDVTEDMDLPKRPLSDATLSQAAIPDSSPIARARRMYPKIEGYHITGVLGQGGMGIVYRAVQAKLNRQVALKVLPAIVGAANPAAVQRFVREAKAAARLHHTHIVPIYDFGESRDAHYYAMELITGRPLNTLIPTFAGLNVSRASSAQLSHILHALHLPEDESGGLDADSIARAFEPGATTSFGGRGRPYFRQVAKWMADTADALHYAHSQGIIHRDIKPANLILASDGRIMVVDLGLAKTAEDQSVTMTGAFLGTLRYTSPEQAMARRVRVDHRTDIYSLGVTMYELLCFCPAFPGDDEKEILGAVISTDPKRPRQINQWVPAELEIICMKCVEKSPDARYDTARALCEDLNRYINDLPIVARPPGPATRLLKFVRRRRAAVLGVTAVVLALFSVFYLPREIRARRAAQVESHIEIGVNFAINGRWDDAYESVDRALSIDPNTLQGLLTYVWMLLEHNKKNPGDAGDSTLKRALAMAQEAAALNPTDSRPPAYIGVLLRRLGEPEQGARHLERAVDLSPNDSASWSNLGVCYAIAGDLDKAMERVHRAAELVGAVQNEYAGSIWRNLASLELHQGMPEAVEHIQQAIECHEDDPQTWIVRTRIALELEGHMDFRVAVLDAQYADRKAKFKNGRVKRMLGLAYLRNDQFDHARKFATEAIDLDDPPAFNYLIMAVALARQGDHATATANLNKAEATWPKELREPGQFVAAVGAGDLWIDTADQLIALRDEAKSLIDQTDH